MRRESRGRAADEESRGCAGKQARDAQTREAQLLLSVFLRMRVSVRAAAGQQEQGTATAAAGAAGEGSVLTDPLETCDPRSCVLGREVGSPSSLSPSLSADDGPADHLPRTGAQGGLLCPPAPPRLVSSWICSRASRLLTTSGDQGDAVPLVAILVCDVQHAVPGQSALVPALA